MTYISIAMEKFSMLPRMDRYWRNFGPTYTIELLDVKSNKLLPSKIRARRIFFLDGAKQFIIDWVNDWELWRNGKIVCGYAGVGGLPSWPFSANGKFFAGLTSGLTYDESVLQILAHR